jgi:hypothetical protein
MIRVLSHGHGAHALHGKTDGGEGLGLTAGQSETPTQ